MNKKLELDLLVADAEIGRYTLVTAIEQIAMAVHASASPTNWLTINPSQRNTSRQRAMAVINEALLYWEGEIRRRNASQ